MNLYYGITGNWYLKGLRHEIEEVCHQINKSNSSIRSIPSKISDETHVIRIKSKRHKIALTKLGFKPRNR